MQNDMNLLDDDNKSQKSQSMRSDEDDEDSEIHLSLCGHLIGL
jgi:hypothetical protein